MGNKLKNNLVKGIVLGGAIFAAKKINNLLNQIELRDKVVLITGGSRGLGLIMARQLAAEGARIAICARDEEELLKAADHLEEADVLTIPCDITDKQQVSDMVKTIHKNMGPVDILINNAGTIQTGPVETMNQKDYEDAMNIHFWGPFYLIHELLPSMIERKGGRIVNISSIGGKISVPHLLPYSVSKFALTGFSEGLAAEFRKNNIKVTTVYPGLMRTGSPRNIDVKGQHEKEYAWFKMADSLPVLSMNAEAAAKKIINAMRRGKKTLTLTFPAKLAIAIHGISPDLNVTFFDLINRALPGVENDNNRKARKGYESRSKASSSILTKSTDKAAERNNEV
jgi:short-subunit dehydrogenase